ncbi:MAG: helix-turn-helix transcriptional regulator [Akkermansia sp.]|nr:helix-turn-helix transcriptional regulator [Akkermansia sp.]
MKHNKLSTVTDIGALVREARKSQSITQEQLAGVAGTGIRLISDLENGKNTIQVEKVIKVIEALGLGLYAMSRWEMK